MVVNFIFSEMGFREEGSGRARPLLSQAPARPWAMVASPVIWTTRSLRFVSELSSAVYGLLAAELHLQRVCVHAHHHALGVQAGSGHHRRDHAGSHRVDEAIRASQRFREEQTFH